MNKNILGYKMFRYIDDENYEMIRINRVYNNGMVRYLTETGEEKKTDIEELKGWIPLEPHGIITSAIVKVGNELDVIVTMNLLSDTSSANMTPRVICRQSVTDFFYTYLSREEHHSYVGVSTSVDNCPTNIPFLQLMTCDGIMFSEIVHIYMNDTLDDFVKLIRVTKYDEVLSNLFDRHAKSTGKPVSLLKSGDDGWCITLYDLLKINSFWIDVDLAFKISTVDFDLDEHIIEKGGADGVLINSLDQVATTFFSRTYRINITSTIIIEYGHDIDLEDYRDINYMLIRSIKTNKLYFMRYLTDGEYVETDLKSIEEEERISATMGLAAYNKYVVKNSQTQK